jgi:hypothetical protein
MRHYSELILLPTYQERLDYLQLYGAVGAETFGFDRYLNQRFYRSPEWKRVRDLVIVRDNGCDLGIDSLPIFGRVYVHHMNPVMLDDVLSHSSDILNPEFLICVSLDTHNAIHYGPSRQDILPIERSPNDTCPWKKGV